MYNRYIPQPDGSYRRNRIEDPTPVPRQHRNPPPPQKQPDPPCEAPEPEKTASHPDQQKSPPCRQEVCCNQQNAGRFLRQLLPPNFDTGDLMVILLLLLIAGDCPEERSNALLTLALYFIM